MKKSNLINGNLVVLRDGSKCVVSEIAGNTYIVDIKNGTYANMNFYNMDLYTTPNFLDVVKVYNDYTCSELLWEREELPLLGIIDKKQLQIFKELGYTHIRRDGQEDIWLYKNEVEIGDFCEFFRDIFKTLEEDERYSITELLGE